jgi:N-succinyl-L-ornithine transcarbamylase
MKNFLHVGDAGNVEELVEAALRYKADPLSGRNKGNGLTAVLLFLNPSLRTRLSTQKAAMNLGMQCIVMNAGSDGWQLEFEDGAVMNAGKAEHIREAAAVISQYADIIGIRTFAGLEDRDADYREQFLSAFTSNASVPVVNLESATVHPLQSLADLVTIREHQVTTEPKIVLSWAPHPRALPQAVSNSFLEWMRAAGLNVVITNPPGYDLAPKFRGDCPVVHDQAAAFEGADFVYVKNWSSYENYGQVLETGSDWMITPEKMALTNSAKFMHCLPVRRNVVVADEVIDSGNALVIEQAGNREWAAQAVLTSLLDQLRHNSDRP